MSALAGAIGTSLFLGSGRALALSGPLGALLSFSMTGCLAAGVVFSMAKMAALVPISGGIVRYAQLFGLVFIPTEIVAASVLMQFWTDLNSAIWITVFGLLMALCNCLFIGFYGELEFTFAILKIIPIFMVNIMAIVIISGGAPQDPGPFVQYLDIEGSLGRFLGFWSAFTNAIYAYSGVDNVALAAAETKNAREAIPKAAKKTFWRIVIFYVITIFQIGMLVPSNNDRLLGDSGTAASPFVIAANLAGIQGVSHFINAVVVTSAWPSGNAGFMTYVRYLFGLAKYGHAPRIFLRLNRFGIPYVAVLLFAAFMALGYMTTSSGAAEVFTWLQDLLSIAILVNWIVITPTYLRFYNGCRRQGIPRTQLPCRAPFQPYFAWLCLVFFSLILLTSGWPAFLKNSWDTRTFVSAYANAPFVLLLYVGHRWVKKTKLIRLEIPIRSLIDIANQEEPSPVVPKKLFVSLKTPSRIRQVQTTPDDFIEVDSDLHTVPGTEMANPATRFHLWVYAARPDVQSIVHTHSPNVSALAAARQPLIVCQMDMTPVYDNCAFLAEWPGLPIADHEGVIVRDALGPERKAIILVNHGQLTAGKSVEEATYLSVYLERAAGLQLRASVLGELVPVPGELAVVARDYLLQERVVGATFDYWGRKL
ncbi:uncharacterized protein KD926_008444 [Aspergillus affinis]|uniref:uncharacterized protein n=1 Tax=Aspergillus affinis TaxID=1070780 RepID=UPI0022FED79B|nr:uncharacterized protein KD926_008444 [Aspergillus affinis]KAI9040243.1 hypothetical protein KD926_008444 [Aspergillus affinis]